MPTEDHKVGRRPRSSHRSAAAAAAGPGLLIGLVIAAVVAFCNATSSAQLAAAYPASGGTYVYGRERLGPWSGFLAGWGFVIGKTASATAMAMAFAAYDAPAGWERPVAITAVIVLAAVNYHGVTRTAGLTRNIVALVLSIRASRPRHLARQQQRSRRKTSGSAVSRARGHWGWALGRRVECQWSVVVGLRIPL